MAAESTAPATTPPKAHVKTLGCCGGGGQAGQPGQAGHLNARLTASSSRAFTKSRACEVVTMTPEQGATWPTSIGAAWLHGEPSSMSSTAVTT